MPQDGSENVNRLFFALCCTLSAPASAEPSPLGRTAVLSFESRSADELGFTFHRRHELTHCTSASQQNIRSAVQLPDAFGKNATLPVELMIVDHHVLARVSSCGLASKREPARRLRAILGECGTEAWMEVTDSPHITVFGTGVPPKVQYEIRIRVEVEVEPVPARDEAR